MSATFVERCIRYGDYDNDGGAMALDQLEICLNLYESGLMTGAQIKAALGLTTPQGAELDEVLATMPSSTTLTVLGIVVLGPNAMTRARWVAKIVSIFTAGIVPWSAFDTPGECRVAMGLAA